MTIATCERMMEKIDNVGVTDLLKSCCVAHQCLKGPIKMNEAKLTTLMSSALN